VSVYAHHGRARRVVIFQLTLRCPLECAHCGVRSGPDNGVEMDTDRAAGWIEALGRDGQTRVVVFTGGEPFVKPGRLRRLAAVARGAGLEVAVVTSASWAPTRARAAEVLAGLPGLSNLTLSADRFHLEFLPLANVRHAAEAALERGLEVGAFVTLANREDDFVGEFRAAMGEALWARLHVRVEHVHLVGRARASATLARLVERAAFETLPDQPCASAAAPTILPDGSVMTCCGDAIDTPGEWAALRVGHLDATPVSAILDGAEANPLIQGLRILGPKAIGDLVAERRGRPFAVRPFERHNICDVCRELVTRPENLRAARAVLDAEAPRLAAARFVLDAVDVLVPAPREP
jgi:hypothetical protein